MYRKKSIEENCTFYAVYAKYFQTYLVHVLHWMYSKGVYTNGV